MTTPTNADYIAAINVLRNGTAIPSGFIQLSIDQIPEDGFDAIVLGNVSTKQVIIAFLGPFILFNPYAAGARADDAAILAGQSPINYLNDLTKFETQATNDVISNNYSVDVSNVFVTGHSLGGYAAELVAQTGGYGGAAFGAPGIPGNTSDPSPSNFIVYVAPSDAVGNFASDSPAAPLLAESDNQYHYGTVQYLGGNSQNSEIGIVVQDFLYRVPSSMDDESSKLGDLAYLAGGLREHSLDYYQQNVPGGFNTHTTAPGAQGQITSQNVSDDSLDLLTAPKIFLGAGVIVDPNSVSITINPDQTITASLVSTDGTTSGIASYSHIYSILQGGASVGPQGDELFGVLPDFSDSSKQILVDAGSRVTVAGSQDTLSIGQPTANSRYVNSSVTLNGNNDTITTNKYDTVYINGVNDNVTGGAVTGTFSSAATAPAGGLGDTTVFTAGGTFTGSSSSDNYTTVNILEQDGSKISIRDAYISPGPAVSIYGTNGLIYEEAVDFTNSSHGHIFASNADGSEAASETYTVNPENSIGSLTDVDFYTLSGDWSRASLSFISGTQTVGTESVYGTEGSIKYNMENNDGTFYEEFDDSKNNPAKSIQKGTFFDPTTGKDFSGTKVIVYSGDSSTTTIYQAGDPNAPTAQFPTGVPSDYPTAAEVWSGIISATETAGSPGSAVKGAAHQAASFSHPIISRALDLFSSPVHMGYEYPLLNHPS